MNKLINDPGNVVKESLEGFLCAFGHTYEKVDGVNGVVVKHKKTDKVSLVTGGGSGHEPVFIGLIGEGMADGVALGNVFASPDPNTIFNVIKAANTGAGVLCLVLNYAGDTMNFGVASELAELDDIPMKIVYVCDDVASAPKGQEKERRGVAGLLLVTKVVGASVSCGYDLDAARKLAEKVNANTRSLGIALTPCSLPGSKPNFEIASDEFEFGMGIHGEPAIRKEKMKAADEIVQDMVSEILQDFDQIENEEVVLLVNGTGATTILELNIVNRKVNEILKRSNVKVYDNIVNSYCTSLEMAGVSISILKLDEEIKKLYDEPAYTPYYYKTRGGLR